MKKLFLKQVMMNRVLYALIPISLMAVYLYGFRVLGVIAVSNLAAFLTEYLFARQKKVPKVSMAVFVTGSLIALTLPPTIPMWIAAVGSAFGVMFGKMVFGGFGMNVFNPAIVGRTFIYISFPKYMTVQWLKPFDGFPGGFLHWMKPENITAASPIITFRDTGVTESLTKISLGTIPGCIGETSAVLILLAAVYLIATKTAKWQPMLACLIGFAVSTVIFYGKSPLFFMLSGGFMFGTVFMVTDPVSMPKNKKAVWIYGILVGFLTVFIRRFSLFAEGFMFALLLANVTMPIVEYALSYKPKKK